MHAFFNLRTPRIMVAVALLLLAFVVAWRYLHPPLAVNGAYLAALMEIRSVLKHPTGAVYSRYDYDPAAVVHLRHDGDDDVTGWVEANDGNGQVIHRDWRVILHPQGGDRYLPVYVHMGSLTVGTDTPDTP